MRKFCFIIIPILFFAFIVKGQHLPEKNKVLMQMLLANKYFMDKWPDPTEDIVTDKVRPSNLWTRATYYEGLMALYQVFPDTSFYKYSVDWGEYHEWKPTYRRIFTRDGDHQCCGQTYIELYQIDPKPERIQYIKANTDSIIKYTNDNDDWSWIDAIQMAMPVFAKLGAVLNDTIYWNKMYQMYMYSKTQHGDSGLYNTIEHLWYRDRNFDPPYETPNGKSCYWSRGNGWVLAALARVLDVLPGDAIYRHEYVVTFKEMAEALINVQREDGFWNASLFDPEDYPGKETSGTGFFTYGLAWGINNGLLDSATYAPYIVKAWNGMANDALHTNGFLGYVQSTGKQPSDGYPFEYNKPANFEDYGLGAFLLAGSEVIKLAPDTLSLTPDSTIFPIDTCNLFNIDCDTTTLPCDSTIENCDSSGNPSNINSFYNTNRLISFYPNPVYNNLTIEYNLSEESNVDIAIYDIQGRKTANLYHVNNQSKGFYNINIELNNLKNSKIVPGLYFLKFETNKNTSIQKIVLNLN